MGPDLAPDTPTLAPARSAAPPATAATPERDGAQALADTLAAAERLAPTNPAVAERLGSALQAQDQVLLAQATPTQTELRPYTLTPERTSAALSTVTERLQSSLVNPITHDDLRAVEDTLARMPTGGANAVVGRMSDAQLQTWATEIQSDGVGMWRGYSAAEQERLYGMLAKNLDATQLARVTRAMDSGPSEVDAAARMGTAIAREAPFGVQARFVEAAATGAANSPELAVAAARVIGGQTTSSDVHRVLSRVSPDQVGAIARESFTSEWLVTVGPGGTSSSSITFDGSHTAAMLRGLAGTGLSRMQAAAVEAASGHLQTLQEGAGPLVVAHTRTASEEIAGGIRTVLERNAPGVVRELEQRRDPDATQFHEYIEAEIRAGRSADVGRMLTRIATDNGTVRSGEWISRTEPGDNGRPYLANAETLGYAVGAVQAAIENITQSRNQQGEIVKNIFGATTGAIGAINPPAGMVAAALTGLGNQGITAVLEGYARGDGTLNGAMRDLSFPRNARGEPFNGDAETPFRTRRLDVVDANK